MLHVVAVSSGKEESPAFIPLDTVLVENCKIRGGGGRALLYTVMNRNECVLSFYPAFRSILASFPLCRGVLCYL
jgi:hypothetical protein